MDQKCPLELELKYYFRKLYIETVIMEIGPINSMNGDSTSITQEI